MTDALPTPPCRRGLPRLAGPVLAALLALPLTLGGPPAAGASPAPGTGGLPGLDAFLDGLLPRQLEELGIPGAAVAVVHDGEPVFAGGYGYADLERRLPFDAERTLTRPGSASKLVTWTAVMQLVEQGRIDLDADVNRYLDFQVPAAFGEPVTMRHLLTHTPGFEAVETDLFLQDAERVPGLRDYLVRRLPARVFPPGRVAGYSNYGTALAGYIVERVSGEPFHEYVAAHIFGPLGMRRATFRQPVPAGLAADLAAGYGRRDGRFVRGGYEYVGPYPAGSASIAAADMARFMIAHLQGGRFGGAHLLEPGTVALMQRRHFSPDARLDKMALGFMERSVNGRRLLWHGGSTFLHNSGLYLLPGEGSGLYVSYNGRGGAAAGEALLQAFMDRYYPAAEPAGRAAPGPGAAARISRWAGEYHFTRSEFTGSGRFVRLLTAAQVKASPDGRLLLSVEGRTQAYVGLEEGLFRHESRDELLVFETDADGRTWIHSDGAPAHPSFTATSAFRVPWHESSSAAALVLLSGLVLFAASPVGWVVAATIVRRRGKGSAAAPRAARLAAACFGGLFLLFLAALAATLGDVDPAYGVPRAFIGGAAPLADIAMWFPLAMAPLALALAVFALLAWRGTGNNRRPYWGAVARLHYAVLALSAAAIVWLLWFWNLTALAG